MPRPLQSQSRARAKLGPGAPLCLPPFRGNIPASCVRYEENMYRSVAGGGRDEEGRASSDGQLRFDDEKPLSHHRFANL